MAPFTGTNFESVISNLQHCLQRTQKSRGLDKPLSRDAYPAQKIQGTLRAKHEVPISDIQ